MPGGEDKRLESLTYWHYQAYSYRRASAGDKLAALLAGYSPATKPINKVRAKQTTMGNQGMTMITLSSEKELQRLMPSQPVAMAMRPPPPQSTLASTKN